MVAHSGHVQRPATEQLPQQRPRSSATTNLRAKSTLRSAQNHTTSSTQHRPSSAAAVRIEGATPHQSPSAQAASRAPREPILLSIASEDTNISATPRSQLKSSSTKASGQSAALQQNFFTENAINASGKAQQSSASSSATLHLHYTVTTAQELLGDDFNDFIDDCYRKLAQISSAEPTSMPSSAAIGIENLPTAATSNESLPTAATSNDNLPSAATDTDLREPAP